MSSRQQRILATVAMAVALLIAGVIWQAACAQATDSTVFVALRTRTSATGKIVSTSATKVDKLPAARVDTVIVKVPGPALHDTLPMVWAPNMNARGDSVIWSGPYAWPTNSRPTNFKLPLGPARVVHDTVFVPVPAPPVPPPSADLFTYDIPSRAGENSVFKGTAYLGRVMVDNVGQWFAYQYTAGRSLMPQSGPYPSKAAAMAALAP